MWCEIDRSNAVAWRAARCEERQFVRRSVDRRCRQLPMHYTARQRRRVDGYYIASSLPTDVLRSTSSTSLNDRIYREHDF